MKLANPSNLICRLLIRFQSKKSSLKFVISCCHLFAKLSSLNFSPSALKTNLHCWLLVAEYKVEMQNFSKISYMPPSMKYVVEVAKRLQEQWIHQVILLKNFPLSSSLNFSPNEKHFNLVPCIENQFSRPGGFSGIWTGSGNGGTQLNK